MSTRGALAEDPGRGPGLRGADADAWDEGDGYALHTKLIMSDERTFYVGSQNIYTANLQEFG